jgi:hypothetical protein
MRHKINKKLLLQYQQLLDLQLLKHKMFQYP